MRDASEEFQRSDQYLHRHTRHARAHTLTHTNAHIHCSNVRACVHADTRTGFYVRACACARARTHTHTVVHTHTHTHRGTHTHTHTPWYTHTHTHTHIHLQTLFSETGLIICLLKIEQNVNKSFIQSSSK